MDYNMGVLLVAVISILLVLRSWAAPLDSNNMEDDSSTIDGYLVDDMYLSILRNGIIDPAKTWPNGTVYYKISNDFDQSHMDNIKVAMDFLQAVSCIHFLEADADTLSYVNIVSVADGCNSRVGYRENGPQRLNLSKNMKKCSNPVIIMHELLHTLGFYHEHMSPLRDDYIIVNWENITPGKESSFLKLNNESVTDFGFGYDYESVMHYGRKANSVNGMDTITPLDSDAKIGQRIGLSAVDVSKLNALYNCTKEEDGEEEEEEEEI